jgi:hypothetical protein
MIILRCGGTGVTASENDRNSKEEEKEKERKGGSTSLISLFLTAASSGISLASLEMITIDH